MRGLQKTIIAGGLLACASVSFAAEESPIAGNVSLNTDYIFRGVSQTAEEPALQGGLDYSHGSGAYVGVWGSNVSFEEDAVNGAHLELDAYAGYKFKVAGLDLDVGAIHYMYPGAASNLDYDFTEGYVGASYGPAYVKFFYSPDFTGTIDESAWYLDVGANFELPAGFGLGLHVGKSDGDYFDVAGNDYVDYKVSLSKEYAGLNFALAYWDTDYSGAQKIEHGAFANDEHIVLTVAKSF